VDGVQEWARLFAPWEPPEPRKQIWSPGLGTQPLMIAGSSESKNDSADDYVNAFADVRNETRKIAPLLPTHRDAAATSREK